MNITMDQREEQGSADRTPARARPIRRGLLIVLVVTVVAAAGALGFYLTGARDEAGAPEASKRTVVAKFSGDEDRVTKTFDVDEGWQIHWDTQGKRFQFAIDGEKFDYGTVIKEKGSASGVTSPVGEGTFRLKVKAQGPWTVQIIQGEPPPEQTE